ncbi:MAG: molybdopterin-dependent oxidoreductase [Anaerolineales bacterium]|nr:molybdopterin-dependent oxidoreductase [Anaerolineales bacterium]
MSIKQFLKSRFTRYTEQAVPADIDLWPAIQRRLQQNKTEAKDTDHDAHPQWYVRRISEMTQKTGYPNISKKKENSMDNEKRKDGYVNRRDFLKVSGATAGVAAVVGASRRPVLRTLEEVSVQQQAANAGEQIFRGVCRPNCFAYCPINLHVRDGKIVKTSMAQHADPQYNRICLRGLSHAQRIYSPNRIKYPMKRTGKRGEDGWERITWDEAITTITDKWKEIQEQYGKQAVAFYTGSGNVTLLHGLMPGAKSRFVNLIGATSIDQSVDAALTVGLNRVTGNAGPWVSSEPKDYINAKTMIAWGANLTEAYMHSWHFVAEAIEAGVKLIVVDPVFTTLASKSDRFVQVRPGSDTALTLSIMNVILEERLHNEEFLLAHTVAPFLVREDTKLFLRMSDLGVEPVEGPADATGKPTSIDPVAVWDPEKNVAEAVENVALPALEGAFEVSGIKVRTAFDLLKEEIAKYPPEEATKITDVDVETIKYLARVCADGPVSHIIGWGPQAYDNGVHTAHASATLCALTGNIGYPGASVGANWNVYPGINFAFTAPDGTVGPTISQLVYRKMVKTGTFQGKPFPIKSMYIFCGNPANTAVHSNEWINDILPTLDLVIVADTVFTDTARYADIVLPAAGWFEQEDIISAGQTHHLELSEKAIEPLYESKPDADIFRMLADKMGIGEFFNKTDDEYLAELLTTPYSEKLGISLESMREKKMIRYFQDPYIAWEGAKFNTPSGRMEFYVEKPTARRLSDEEIDWDREHLPTFFPPTEAWPENPLYQKYPLVLLSTRPKFRVHSQWYDTPWLRELEPEPTVRINAIDAAKRDIKNGDYVEVFNHRGRAVVKAVVSQGMRPGVMVFAKGWQRNQYVSGDLSELASSSFDPIGVNQSFMDELAEVRKWNGKA